MHPDTPQTHRSIFRIPTKTALRLLTICLLAATVPLALYVRVKSKNYVSPKSGAVKKDPNRVTVQAAGRGQHFLNLQDGREMSVTYRGDQVAVTALQNGAAQARALASADFDGNGTPDVVAG